MRQIDLNCAMGAIFSDDRKYRYALWRSWSNKKPLMCIGLNPSTANEISDDATISRLMARSDKLGYGGLLMANLYAYVSTDPRELLKNEQTIGLETDDYIKQMVSLAGIVICAWGSFKPVFKRAPDVVKMIPQPYCLGINKDGNPKHPLYISYDTNIARFNQ